MQTNIRPLNSKWIPALGLAAVLSLGGAFLWNGHGGAPSWAASPEPPPAAVASANDLSAAFRYASQRVLPSVVTIRTVSAPSARSSGSQTQPIPEDLSPLLKQFFGDRMPQFELRSPQMPRREGMGSGLIIDSSGVILTNNHVAGGGGKVLVRLQDGREFTAVEVKTDPSSDLAIVKIEAGDPLPAATLGDSDALQIGDWVLAIGSPFGLSETVTAGIISAKSRGMGITEREDFLQTDAAINPGNSGGPLVNLKGEVVGINTAISTRGGGSDGVGFAVPINLAKWVGQQLLEKGAVERAFLGIGIQQVSSELSQQFGLSTVKGALVTEVRPDSAAAHAGLQVGDVVVEFDGRAIQDPKQLQSVVERAAIDQTHKLTIVRNGERHVFEVKLQPLSRTLTVADAKSETAAPTEFDKLGLQVSDLTADVAQQLGLSGESGVVITSVRNGSPAAELGLREGMLIARVGSKPVANSAEFQQAVQQADLSKGLLLLVKSGDGSRFVVLKAE